VKKIIIIIIVFVSGYCPHNIFSQGFEGRVYCKISYLPKVKYVKEKYLEMKYGNRMVFCTKDGYLKKTLKYNTGIIFTSISDYTDSVVYSRAFQRPYFVKSKISNDTTFDLKKQDSTVEINSEECVIYKNNPPGVITCFYLKNNAAFNPVFFSNLIETRSEFISRLVRVTREYAEYTAVTDYVSTIADTINISEFSTNSLMIINNHTKLINDTLYYDIRDSLRKCIRKNMIYPPVLQLKNMEGKINIYIVVDSTGAIGYVGVTPDFFRYYYKEERIYNKKRENRISRLIEKMIRKALGKCTAEFKFSCPETKDGPVNILIKIPYIFGSYD
jgi:hypothetical protein